MVQSPQERLSSHIPCETQTGFASQGSEKAVNVVRIMQQKECAGNRRPQKAEDFLQNVQPELRYRQRRRGVRESARKLRVRDGRWACVRFPRPEGKQRR